MNAEGASPSTKRYTVTNEIVGSERATVQFYIGTDVAQALSALLMAATSDRGQEDIPESARYRVTSVHMEIEEVEGQ